MSQVDIFKQHILFEFLHNSPNKVSLLYEGRSVVPGIDTILERIMMLLDNQIYYVTSNNVTIQNKCVERYNDINALRLNNLFFDSINFTVVLINSEESHINGGFAIGGEFVYTGDDTKIPLDIDFTISAPNESEFRRLLYLGFGHEITHAYNIWQWMIKNKRNFNFNDFNKKSRYLSFKSHFWDAKNEECIKLVMYRMSRTEVNAHIAQLRQELLLKKNEINDTESAMKTIYSTTSYRIWYKFLNKFVHDIQCLTDKSTQDNLIHILNFVGGKNFTTYNQFLKYFKERWFYLQKEYMTKASKIVYDIYSENHHMFDAGRDLA